MNKFIIIVIVAVVSLGGYFIFNSEYQPTSSAYKPSNEQIDPQPNINTQPLVVEVPTVNENVITYTDTGYSPNTITIKNGETVTFKNESSKLMWPASAMHPDHILYSGTSLDKHCPDTTNSAFDACAEILVGAQWSFKFDKTGAWGFHDHLSPKNFGKITVE